VPRGLGVAGDGFDGLIGGAGERGAPLMGPPV
jgi:hypothetical protein